jgi:hypothetical protein
MEMAKLKVAADAEPKHGPDDGGNAFAEAVMDAPPTNVDVSQPLAVFLQWLLLGVFALSFALLRPTELALDALAGAFPKWSQVAGAGAIALFLLGMIERAKRDRRAVGYVLNVLSGLLLLLALREDLLAGQPTSAGWFIVIAAASYGAAHLLLFEDWVAGNGGPRFRTAAAALRDLATLPWFFWFSKAGLTLRAHDRQRKADERFQRDKEHAERLRAEDAAAAAKAERKRNEDQLAAAQAAERAAQAELLAAEERQKADEAKRVAAEAEARRAAAELEVQSVRQKSEELKVQADAAVLNHTRLRAEKMEADRHFLQAAIAAKQAAEAAEQRRIESARARELLARAQEALIQASSQGDGLPAAAERTEQRSRPAPSPASNGNGQRPAARG